MFARLESLRSTYRVAGLLVAVLTWSAVGQAQERSLYDRIGGLAGISVVVTDFIDALVPDSLLNANPAIDAARIAVPAAYLKYHVTAQLCQVTGGPCTYHGRTMKQAHAHLNITAREWDRAIHIFRYVLGTHLVPAREQEELLAIVRSTRPDIVAAQPRD